MKYRVYQSHNPETVQYVAGFQIEDTAGKRNETEHFQWEHLMDWHLTARWSFLKCNLIVNVYVGTDGGKLKTGSLFIARTFYLLRMLMAFKLPVFCRTK
jgi:hypothetical protein